MSTWCSWQAMWCINGVWRGLHAAEAALCHMAVVALQVCTHTIALGVVRCSCLCFGVRVGSQGICVLSCPSCMLQLMLAQPACCCSGCWKQTQKPCTDVYKLVTQRMTVFRGRKAPEAADSRPSPRYHTLDTAMRPGARQPAKPKLRHATAGQPPFATVAVGKA
jgi:hypothetical protein